MASNSHAHARLSLPETKEAWTNTDPAACPPPRRARSLPCKRPQCRGIEAVFARHVGSKYRAGRLGIGGDQTFHLRWRLLDGELPARRQPRLVVLLIGTNDLGAVAEQGGAALEAASRDVAARSAGRRRACCACCCGSPLASGLPGGSVWAVILLLSRRLKAVSAPVPS